MSDLSEFSFINVDELDLVQTPANAFNSPLLAKSRSQPKKGKHVKTSKIQRLLAKAKADLEQPRPVVENFQEGNGGVDTLPVVEELLRAQPNPLARGQAASLTHVFGMMKAKADEAQRAGGIVNENRARSLRKELCEAKMIAQENALRAGGRVPATRMGPNSVDLFKGSSHTLPTDTAVGGI